MKNIFKQTWFIVILLMVFPPLGIVLMFHFTQWRTNVKMVLAIIFGLIWIVAIVISVNQEAQLAAQNLCARWLEGIRA